MTKKFAFEMNPKFQSGRGPTVRFAKIKFGGGFCWHRPRNSTSADST
jgi:hypothetical protein